MNVTDSMNHRKILHRGESDQRTGWELAEEELAEEELAEGS